jgi:hypothetical protein
MSPRVDATPTQNTDCRPVYRWTEDSRIVRDCK